MLHSCRFVFILLLPDRIYENIFLRKHLELFRKIEVLISNVSPGIYPIPPDTKQNNEITVSKNVLSILPLTSITFLDEINAMK